ncbi:MAG: class I SAM-dependent methyltransferase [Candidatus Thorarchaeota archaeon]
MSSFDALALAYDNSIDWEARLGREIPFLVNCLANMEGSRILDLACGSGRHAIALATRGADVVGLDSSKAMIDTAQKLVKGTEANIEFIVADILDMKQIVNGKFDLVTCLGNSLALVPTLNDLKQVIEDAVSVLRPGGTFVSQTLNFEEILGSGFRFFPAKGGRLHTGEEVVFSRFYDHSVKGDISTLVLSSFIKQNEIWTPMVSTQSVLRLDIGVMEGILKSAGVSDWVVFSDYSGSGFVQSSHRNMVFKVRK